MSPRARAARLCLAALATGLFAALLFHPAGVLRQEGAQTEPPADALKALYDEVMALIAADRRVELRDRVELACGLYPDHPEGNPAAWAAYKGAGHLAEKLDDPLEEERYCRIAFEASARLGNPRARSRALAFLSTTWIGLSRLDEARDLIEARLATIPPGDEYVAVLLIPLAEREIPERRFADAVRHLAAVEASAPPPETLARVHGARGQLALDLGRIEVAAEAFAREEELLAREGIAPSALAKGLAISTLHRANLRLATDRSALLDRLVADALARPELARALPSLPSALRLRSAIGRMAEERLGHRAEPGAAVLLGEVLADPAATEPERIGARLRLAHLATNAGEMPQAAAELDLLPERLGTLDEAYRAALRSRIARANASGDAREAAGALERAWERLVGDWRDEEVAGAGSGVLHYEQVRLLLSERIETALAAAAPGSEESALAALAIALRAGELGSLHRALAAPAATLEAVRAELIAPGGGIAIFLPAADRSHLLLVDRERVSHHFLPPRDAIERARRALLELRQEVPATAPATEERRARFRAEARRLAERLLPPAAEERVAGWSTLTVVGLDLLGPLPVAEFVLADGAALGDRTAIGALPSLSVGLALARRAEARVGPPRRGAALLAAPRLAAATLARFPAAAPLPFDEAAALALLAPHARSAVRIGDEATFEALSFLLGGDPAVLQLLLHGVRDPERLGRVSLLLAGETDAVIAAECILSLPAPPLVIATACASGEGPLRLGDPGSVDWMGAFLRAGADSVIVSTGDLGWSATLDRSEALHAAIAAGLTPADALQRSREGEVASGSIDPAHRSPLIVFGLAHRPISPREE